MLDRCKCMQIMKVQASILVYQPSLCSIFFSLLTSEFTAPSSNLSLISTTWICATSAFIKHLWTSKTVLNCLCNYKSDSSINARLSVVSPYTLVYDLISELIYLNSYEYQHFSSFHLVLSFFFCHLKKEIT